MPIVEFHNVPKLQSSVFLRGRGGGGGGDLKSQDGYLYTLGMKSFANKVDIHLP